MARPVIDRLPHVNQLDEFACRQLDRFGPYRRPSDTDHIHDDAQQDDRIHSISRSAPTHDSAMPREELDSRSARQVPTWLEGLHHFIHTRHLSLTLSVLSKQPIRRPSTSTS